MNIKHLGIPLLLLMCLVGCDEQNDFGNQIDINNNYDCYTKVEIDALVKDKVEAYVAEAITPTINIAVANTLTDVFNNVTEYTKSGTRLFHKKIELSDGSQFFENKLYDSKLKTNCTVTKDYNYDKYCCYPDVINIEWNSADKYDPDIYDIPTYIEGNFYYYLWSGFVNSNAKPCYDQTSDCTLLANDVYSFCRITKINDDYQFTNCKLISTEDFKDMFVCE